MITSRSILLLVGLASLSLPLLAHGYSLSPGQITAYNYATLKKNPSGPTVFLKSCLVTSGTGTAVTASSIVASVGNTVTITQTGTACDGTWTLTGVQNSSPYTYTWSSGETASYSNLDTNDQDVILLKVDAAHYYRYFREGTSDAHDPGVIREQTSSDGINWTAATTLFADTSGGCQGNNYDLRGIAGAVMPDGEQFLVWTKYCWISPATFVELDSGITTGGAWGASSKFVTPAAPTYQWIATGASPAFFMPNGSIALVLDGCPASGPRSNCKTIPQPAINWIVSTCNNGLTWGDTSCPNSLILVANNTQTTLPTNELGVLWVGGETLIGLDRNYNYAGNGWNCTTTSCPLVFASSPDLGTTWTFTPTNFAPSCSGHGTLVDDTMVSPILFNPGLGGPVTAIWAERCIVSGPGNYGYLQSLTFDPQAAISNPTGFAAPQAVWNTTPGIIDFGYPSCSFSTTSTMSCYWDSEQYGGGPLNLIGGSVTYVAPPATVVKGAAVEGMVIQ